MVKYCKGTCKELEIKNHKKIYYLGLKRCSICEVFFKTNEKFCSCCGHPCATIQDNQGNQKELQELLKDY